MAALILIFTILSIENPANAALSQEGLVELFDKKIRPGETLSDQIKEHLGKPYRVVREGASREIYFYNMGTGMGLDATVSVKKGVVEYLTYLCGGTLSEVEKKYGRSSGVEKKLASQEMGRKSSATQLLFEEQGRGYIYDSRTKKIKSCVTWEVGKKFDDLGR